VTPHPRTTIFREDKHMKGWKTVIAFVANAIAVTLIPGVDEQIAAHPAEYGVALSIVGVILRAITRVPAFNR